MRRLDLRPWLLPTVILGATQTLSSCMIVKEQYFYPRSPEVILSSMNCGTDLKIDKAILNFEGVDIHLGWFEGFVKINIEIQKGSHIYLSESPFRFSISGGPPGEEVGRQIFSYFEKAEDFNWKTIPSGERMEYPLSESNLYGKRSKDFRWQRSVTMDEIGSGFSIDFNEMRVNGKVIDPVPIYFEHRSGLILYGINC